MRNRRPTSFHFLTTLFFYISSNVGLVTSKSTIEPCSNSNSCNALLGYTLYTDLKVSEVASLFQIDPISLLTSNSIDISYPDVDNHILPSQLFLKIPILCSCLDGIRKSLSTHYKTRPSDTLSSIADTIYAGLVSSDQIKDANSISDPSLLDVGQTLVVPLPCTCFNGTDNSLPAIYMSYVVQSLDTMAGIASRYSTTITDLMTVNSLGSVAIDAGDILAIPFSACASNYPRYASDFGLSVPNGSYAITASHCVQCSCVYTACQLHWRYLVRACNAETLISCLEMLRGNRALPAAMLLQCSYGGYVNGTIITMLSTSLEPRCPGPQQFPPLIAPPSSVSRESLFAPAPAPSQSGGATATSPASSVVPSSGAVLGLPPTNAPSGRLTSGSSSVNPLASFPIAIVLGLFFECVLSFSL
ncbi:hypothetical protein HYC85_007812 [Camellia sinensis]|uniref:LysM domain-containing protein n=1 Tax=Camellia sinensis TaxID=4442 RepID=A0A7J7HSD0_CAMSI|nr:hypothetical protein HYC85_007812 [Camellia sinensis]